METWNFWMWDWPSQAITYVGLAGLIAIAIAAYHCPQGLSACGVLSSCEAPSGKE